jgi:hypothetical protein
MRDIANARAVVDFEQGSEEFDAALRAANDSAEARYREGTKMVESFKEPNEYAYRSDKLDEYGIIDIDDATKEINRITDKKRRQRRKRLNVLNARKVRFRDPDGEVVEALDGDAEAQKISLADLLRTGVDADEVLRSAPWRKFGVASAVSPVGSISLFEGEIKDGTVLAGEAEWIDVEFEVALDSGCTDHVCAMEDIPGYMCIASPGSRAGQHFIVGNGARIPNQGEAILNLETMDEVMNGVKSTFQVAKVSRPLMSVGRICDAGMKVVFEEQYAYITEKCGRVVARFERKPGGGLYLAKLRLKAPFPRQA